MPISTWSVIITVLPPLMCFVAFILLIDFIVDRLTKAILKSLCGGSTTTAHTPRRLHVVSSSAQVENSSALGPYTPPNSTTNSPPSSRVKLVSSKPPQAPRTIESSRLATLCSLWRRHLL